ncbi:flagellar basal body rod modification protein [Campylobacter majalis]|uniref:flagellar basal body rod modification protein n=1 Tax=Campylobacter majalis TaxID=2790656 RepID=UPI003D6993B3
MANIVDSATQFTADKLASQKAKSKSDAAGVTNPNAQLDKDAFMKLLLTELQYQDPTSPMDTEKMLTQTSQLATLEMQQNTNDTMKTLVQQLKTTGSMYALSSLGKMATLNTNTISVKDDTISLDVPIYFKNSAVTGMLEILDSTNNVVRTVNLENISSGTQTLKWDLLNDNGVRVNNGGYTVRATYLDENGKTNTTTLGTYPVEAVKFVDGKAMVKIAGEYRSTDDIAEFYDNPQNVIIQSQNAPQTSTNNDTNKPSDNSSNTNTSNNSTNANIPKDVLEAMTDAILHETNNNISIEEARQRAYEKLTNQG